MKVVVCGAGQVGSNIARHLATEANHVTVIDHAPDLVRKISDSLEVRGIVGHASHPGVLERAGARDADMLIAVTHSDEVNMVACQVAASLFNVPTKIARVRSQSYLQPAWADLFSREKLPIDVIISPEIEVARAISRRLQVPGAFDNIPLAEGRVQVIGVRCSEECPILDTPLRQLTELFPDLNIVILAILRAGQAVLPRGEERLKAGDDVYFVVDSTQVSRGMAAFGHEEPEAHRIVIVGGGNIGLYLAQEIENTHPGVRAKVIEQNKERAEFAAQSLSRSVVIHGSALEVEILEEANADAAEAVVAVTNDDEVNILSSLLAKRAGARRAMTLVNNMSYESLIATLGVDVVVVPQAITVSTILQHVRRGRIRSVHSLRENLGEVIEAEALETSRLIGRAIKDADLPKGIVIGALIRDERVIIPRLDTVVKAKDRVIMFARPEAIRAVEKIFAVSLQFF
ncbi:MAG: Trk system potassium transporter TrkA [Alphaproteobacteria bacterium]